MTSQPAEKRFRRIENDLTSVYELLGDIQATVTGHDGRLDRIESHLAGHDTRFDGLEGQLLGLDGRLGQVEGKLDTVISLLGGDVGRRGDAT